MKPISETIKDLKPGRFQTPPNSAMNEQVDKVCMLIDGNYKRFPYWIGRLKHLEPSEIHDMLKTARTGKSAPALFQFLLKKSKQ